MEVPLQYLPGSNNLPSLISLPTLNYLPSKREVILYLDMIRLCFTQPWPDSTLSKIFLITS